MLRVENLSVKVGDFSLDEINFEIKNGEHFVLLGPSGAGKTVLVEAICGIKKIKSGRVLLNGVDITFAPLHKRNISYLPQDLCLFPGMSVLENIIYPLKRRKTPEDEMMKKVDSVCELLNIKHIIERKDINSLSGGEKQRVALARALIWEPKILIIDEPFSALDLSIKRSLQRELVKISRETSTTIIHVTHDREEAFMLGDRIGILIDGRLHQIGTKDEIYYHPATIETARYLISENNIFEGEVVYIRGEEVGLKNEHIFLVANRYSDIKGGDRVFFGIRPEEISVIRPGRPLRPQVQHNLFKGFVKEIYEKGASHILMVEAEKFLIEIDIPNCAFRDLQIQTGNEITFSMKKRAIWYIKR